MAETVECLSSNPEVGGLNPAHGSLSIFKGIFNINLFEIFRTRFKTFFLKVRFSVSRKITFQKYDSL